MKVLFLLFGLLSGITIGFNVIDNTYNYSYPQIPHILIISIILSVICLLLSLKQKQIFFFLAGFCIGFGLGMFNFQPVLGKSIYKGMVVKSSENYVIIISNFKKYYVYSSNNTYQFGDFITVEGIGQKYIRTTYESQFDIVNYFKSNGISYEISNPKITDNFLFPLRIVAYEKKFASNFNENAKTLINSILFNRKNYDSSIISNASDIGILIVLSSSGIIASSAISLIRKILFKFDDKFLDAIEILFLILLTILSPYKVGIWKLLIIDILRISNKKIFNGRLTSLNRICVAGIILVLFNRYNALQVGYLLSFGISLINCFFSQVLRHNGKVAEKIYRIVLLQSVLLPVNLILNFGKFNVLSLLFIQLLIPFVSIFLLLGVISFIIYPFKTVFNIYGDWVDGVTDFLSKANFQIYVDYHSPYIILFYYLFLIFVLLLIELRLRKIRNISIIAGISIFLLNFIPIVNTFTGEVSFINVGQGDSILIRDRFTTVMIDTGGVSSFDIAKETLIPFLKRKKIYKIDCLIGSHGDFDHTGGVSSLIANFNVKRYIDDLNAFPLNLGNFTFVNYNVYSGNSENEKSSVLGLNFLGKSFLFTGDADENIEKQIIKDNPNLRVDILKVGHHGSKTSTSADFLDLIKPKEAVISCGAKNKYGHPTSEVLSRLNERNIRIRRTDIEGTISYTSFAS